MNSKIKLKVTGKNINCFVTRLIQNKIEIFDLESISYQEINILISRDDYQKIKKIKSIYKLEILTYKGLITIKRSIKINKILISILF